MIELCKCIVSYNSVDFLVAISLSEMIEWWFTEAEASKGIPGEA